MTKRFLLKLAFGVMVIFFLPLLGYAGEAMQTQPSSDGKVEGAIIGVKVKRGVLTVKVSLKNVSENRIEPEMFFREVYFTDIKENKKYFCLKDSNGRYISGPQDSGFRGGTFKDKIPFGEKRIIWMKFPAPPESSDTIDIFLPGMLPFEEIEIKK